MRNHAGQWERDQSISTLNLIQFNNYYNLNSVYSVSLRQFLQPYNYTKYAQHTHVQALDPDK